MKKYFLISLVLLCVQPGWAKKEKKRDVSSERAPTTYHFVLPDGENSVAKDFKVTITKADKTYTAQLKVKLFNGELKEIQLPCYNIVKTKSLRCVREEGGGQFELSVLASAKGDMTHHLKVRHLDLGGEQEDTTAIAGPKENEYLEVDGKIVP